MVHTAHLSDHVILQEKVFQLRQVVEVLYFFDDVVLKVERLETDELI